MQATGARGIRSQRIPPSPEAEGAEKIIVPPPLPALKWRVMPSRPVAFIKLSGQERGSGRPRRGGNCRQWGFGFLFTASPGGSFWQVFVFSGRPRSVFPVYLLDHSKNLFFYKFCIIQHRFSTEIFFLSGESSGMKSPLFSSPDCLQVFHLFLPRKFSPCLVLPSPAARVPPPGAFVLTPGGQKRGEFSHPCGG